MDVESRAVGAVIGAAVGDALGAPFEFKPGGLYLNTFPEPVHEGLCEMIGGGAFDWAPGEFTDDTQMGMALAESILEAGGFDPDSTWSWFTAWVEEAPDVGTTTRTSLMHNDWRQVKSDPRAAPANGALMRSFALPVACLGRSVDETRDIALRQSALTHPHPVSGWGAWIGVEMCRRFILGEDAFDHVDDLIAQLPDEYQPRFAELLDPSWSPENPHESNGSVWGCLAEAVWAVRSTSSYERAVVAAVNLGDDTDTVACVAGALAGARYGLGAIPLRWRSVVHGRLLGPHGLCEYDADDLEQIALSLLALSRS